MSGDSVVSGHSGLLNVSVDSMNCSSGHSSVAIDTLELAVFVDGHRHYLHCC